MTGGVPWVDCCPENNPLNVNEREHREFYEGGQRGAVMVI